MFVNLAFQLERNGRSNRFQNKDLKKDNQINKNDF